MKKSFYYDGVRYYVRGTDETDCAIKIALKKSELERNVKKIDKNMLVNDWIKMYLETYKINSLADVSYRDLKSRINKNITSKIGHLALKDVKPIHCQQILNELSGFSTNHIKKVNNAMKDIFEKAVDNNLLLENPAQKLIIPKGYKSSRRAITKAEREVILNVAEYNPYGLWVLLMLYCGLRPHETSLIQGRHIDRDKKVLHVEGTKTDNANRYVPIPDVLMDKLPKLDPFEYLFTSEVGTPINDDKRCRMWNSFKRDMNIKMGCKVFRNQLVPPLRVAEDLVPYCLRHTYCTDLQAAGVPINVAKELMGHSDISLTSRIYTHKSEEAFNSATNSINAFHSKLVNN